MFPSDFLLLLYTQYNTNETMMPNKTIRDSTNAVEFCSSENISDFWEQTSKLNHQSFIYFYTFFSKRCYIALSSYLLCIWMKSDCRETITRLGRYQNIILVLFHSLKNIPQYKLLCIWALFHKNFPSGQLAVILLQPDYKPDNRLIGEKNETINS